jgi:hypothetical protein
MLINGVAGFYVNIFLNSILKISAVEIKRGEWTKKLLGDIEILIRYVMLLNSSKNTIG